MADRSVHLRIRRQESPQSPPYWEEFLIPYRADMNVITCLQDIQRNPVTKEGKKTTPVIWDCSCLEEVCGICTMNINGRARQACSALVDQLDQPIVLEPLRKFPLLRDLSVDRQKMFDDLKKVHAWIQVDGYHDLGPGPRMDPATQQWAYVLSTCMTCGCCLEACPNYGPRSHFIGPAAVSQVRLFNAHPTGAMQAEARLRSIMGVGGVTDCGNAQNCVEVCPKSIPLTTSLAEMFRATTKKALRDLLRA
jgi:succinate dehydrogenase / fumarate reductase iron-sulfur subunit